ncbi:MAG TPA: hypothetical protein ENI17_06210 [Pseudomonas xinjiangensis]|uniref:Doubled CXXCH domain-containing protein n=2 Tax=root TaxID=1 RepID=A0A7V1BRL2_9GAMM|nr:hypothetical protein [Halopseudomonas xinjiangensis]HEC47205.1 hypothetical protein [Halopseudomonas xinjiangensis]
MALSQLRRYWWASILAVLVLGIVAGGGWLAARPIDAPAVVSAAERPDQAAPVPAEFIGSHRCVACHADQHRAWQSSQHAHAMTHASEQSVLGDFDDATFEYNGVNSRFYRRDGGFFVHTDGADGELREFEVLYTFGLEPLQQYLVDLGGGRLQALSIAWDCRLADQGGQRWFHIYPDEAVSHRDILHWTRPSQNWNFMCADCHVTDFRKGYDPQADSFDSRWSELGVGCEACHGPGSAHLRWADGELELADKGLLRQFDERQGMHWLFELERVTARRSVPPGEAVEQAVCAQCHSMRSQVAEGFQHGGALLDHYRPELLRDPLYHPDGQQREEVFISGSFAQSKMHAAGVTCSDCHEPHGQQLRAEGNALCATCHSAAQFDQPSHHFHPADSSGAQCVNCHMPQTRYMVIDSRRDHQLAVPRPDISASLGTPNACNACHVERTADWSAEQVAGWYPQGQWREAHFASVLAAADAGEPGGQAALRALLQEPQLATVVRASALARLQPEDTPQARELLTGQLASPDPQIRLGAVVALEQASPSLQRLLLPPLLDDELRSVRSAAARLLAGTPLPPADQAALRRALQEYEMELTLHAERADYLNQRALLRLQQQRPQEAEQQWRLALQRDPLHSASYLNLADLLRAQARESEAERLLRTALEHLPDEAMLHNALGLSLVRQQQHAQGLASLQQAYKLRPEDRRIAYVLAVALEPEDPTAALNILEQAIERHPHDQNLLWAAASFSWRHDQLPQARQYVQQLLELEPEHRGGRALLKQF